MESKGFPSRAAGVGEGGHQLLPVTVTHPPSSQHFFPHAGSSLHFLTNHERLYLQKDATNPELLYVQTETGERLFNVSYVYKTVVLPNHNTGLVGLLAPEQTTTLVQAIKLLDHKGTNIMCAQLGDDIGIEAYNYCVEYNIQVDHQNAGRFRRNGCCSQSCSISWTEQNGELELASEGCCCCCQLFFCPCAINSFKIKQTGADGEGKAVIGEMSESWPENQGVFGVQFPKSMSVLGKTMILASALLVNRNFFNQEQFCGMECSCHAGTTGCKCIVIYLAIFIPLAICTLIVLVAVKSYL